MTSSSYCIDMTVKSICNIFHPISKLLLNTHPATDTHVPNSQHTPILHYSKLRACRSLYLPEYGRTMVMGMNSCGPFSLTSCGPINALVQARTLTYSQSDTETYTPPERRGDVVLRGVNGAWAYVQSN